MVSRVVSPRTVLSMNPYRHRWPFWVTLKTRMTKTMFQKVTGWTFWGPSWKLEVSKLDLLLTNLREDSACSTMNFDGPILDRFLTCWTRQTGIFTLCFLNIDFVTLGWMNIWVWFSGRGLNEVSKSGRNWVPLDGFIWYMRLFLSGAEVSYHPTAKP